MSLAWHHHRFLEILMIALLFYFGPKLISIIGHYMRQGRVPESTAIPLWMSQERLAYSSGEQIIDHTLNLNEILSVAPDFANGSPALSLSLKDQTVKLISSELNSLKKQLYKLRPDLEPTS